MDTKDCIMSEALGPAESRQRIEELETRVKWLEGALTSLLQERRARDRRGNTGVMFTLDEDMIAPDVVSGVTLHQAPELTQPMEVLRHKPAPPPDVDAMRFTNSFAMLDERLREQLEAENCAQAVPMAGPPVLIDPTLIDRAFARPAPQRIEVRCALEESYPHLLERIVATWGEPESVAFLRKLIVDERGSRQGFPFEVMSELLVLGSLAAAPGVQEWRL
jgi:hypothetical protein